MGESLKARVRPGSKRTLGSYHETHKGAKPKPYWVAIPRVGRNPESVQEYLHERLVPHEHTYKHVIISKLPWSGEARRLSVEPGG